MLVVTGQGMLVELGDKELSLCWCFAGHGVLVGLGVGQGVLIELGDKELILCCCILQAMVCCW